MRLGRGLRTIFIDPLNDLELTSGKAAYVSYVFLKNFPRLLQSLLHTACLGTKLQLKIEKALLTKFSLNTSSLG